NGSVARREYTSGSDIDHFFLSTVPESTQEVDLSAEESEFRSVLEGKGLKMPASGGVFEGALNADKLLSPIGGDNDTNKTLTRRMLFLLEGEWIFNQKAFEELRVKLISQYVADSLDQDKLALYLLNDIIRYWRTICIDFEHKTSGGKKPRALRLAKLRMSRMLLCFAGMVAVAEASDLPPNEKRERLVELFSQQGIGRLEGILSDEFSSAKLLYGQFLSSLDDSNFRSKLNLDGDEGMQTPEFEKMTELARKFKSELVDIMLNHYGPSTRIVHAILL
ncbi:MAG: hypothetical protein ABJJ37_19140, partial [Roseibium sp.]